MPFVLFLILVSFYASASVRFFLALIVTRFTGLTSGVSPFFLGYLVIILYPPSLYGVSVLAC